MTSTVVFYPDVDDDANELKCSGSNPALAGAAVSDAYNISVLCKIEYVIVKRSSLTYFLFIL